jgi:hypothetical protein
MLQTQIHDHCRFNDIVSWIFCLIRDIIDGEKQITKTTRVVFCTEQNVLTKHDYDIQVLLEFEVFC